MYISLNWINDHVDISGIDATELAHRITMSTAEVEEIIHFGRDIKNVVVGKIIEINPHPESKKLSIVKVDIGDGFIQSVCGAPNVALGIMVPCAKIGGSIKGLEEVISAKLAGVNSDGVLCSAKEIGISADHSGLLILQGDYKLGTDIKEIIDIEDIVIDIDNKSLTHRPDLWGHYGFAREIAAILGRKLKPLQIEEIKNDLPELDIKIEDSEKCYRYSGLTIDNITERKSLLNMQTRLFYCGMRPINLLVDLSNYMMLEIGQPTHAFDKNFIKKIVVKSTDIPIKFTTLDSSERVIPENVLMIHNQDGPVAVAGIMGGENTEISDDTTSVFLESANFEGPSTRKNAVRIGIRTEASARYEKMLDPELTVLAVKRFVKLLRDVDKNAVVSSSLTDIYPTKYEKLSVKIDKAFIVKYMGKDIGLDRMVEILRSIEFDVAVNGEELEIAIPSFRATKDVSMKADIVEEIARIYGYDNIEPDSNQIILEPLIVNEQRELDHKVKAILSEKFELSEVHSHIWYDNRVNAGLGINPRSGLRVVNSLEGDNETLRDSLAPIMLNFASVNVKNFNDFGLFEIGSVFTIKDNNSECHQHKNLSILLASKSESEDELFYRSKGILSSIFSITKKAVPKFKTFENSNFDWIHPIKAAKVVCDCKEIGYITVIHPKIKSNIDKKLNMVLVEINSFDLNDIAEKTVKYIAPSKYQEVSFDLNILVNSDKLFEDVYGEISSFDNILLNECKFIDLYKGKGIPEGKNSMTFNFRIGSKDHTLSSEEIDGFRNRILEYIDQKGYELR